MLFNPHNGILDMQVPITAMTRNKKQSTTKGIIQERIYDDVYRALLTNWKQKVLKYSSVIEMRTKN